MRKYSLKINNTDITEFTDFRDAVIRVEEDADTKNIYASINDIVLIDKYNNGIINNILNNARSIMRAEISVNNVIIEGTVDLSTSKFWEKDGMVGKVIISININNTEAMEIMLKNTKIMTDVYKQRNVRVAAIDPLSFITLFLTSVISLVLNILNFINIYNTQRATSAALAATAAPGAAAAVALHRSLITIIRIIHIAVIILQTVLFVNIIKRYFKTCEQVHTLNIVQAIIATCATKNINVVFDFDKSKIEELELMFFANIVGVGQGLLLFDLIKIVMQLTNSRVLINNNTIVFTKKYASYKDNNVSKRIFDNALKEIFNYNINEVVGRYIIRFQNNDYNAYYHYIWAANRSSVTKYKLPEAFEVIYTSNNVSFKNLEEVNINAAIAPTYHEILDPVSQLNRLLDTTTVGFYALIRVIVSLFKKAKCDYTFLLPYEFKTFLYTRQAESGEPVAADIKSCIHFYYDKINKERIMKIYENVKVKMAPADFVALLNSGFVGIKRMEYYIEKNYAIADVYDYASNFDIQTTIYEF